MLGAAPFGDSVATLFAEGPPTSHSQDNRSNDRSAQAPPAVGWSARQTCHPPDGKQNHPVFEQGPLQNLCHVPRRGKPGLDFVAFGERTPNAWFAKSPERPLMFFAGIWVPQWESVRKIKEGRITADFSHC